jgi:hypothetical protein
VKNPPDAEHVKELDARMAKIDEQMASIQQALAKTEGRRMLDRAKNKMIGDQTMSLQIETMKLNKSS